MISLMIKYEKFGADVINQLMQGPKDFKLVVWLMVLAVGESIFVVKICSIVSPIMPGSILDNDALVYAFFEMSLLARVVVVALIPSFCEELIFRGVITKRLAQSYSEVKSIVLSAILFSAFHLSLVQMIPTFLGGLLLGFVYIRTKNIYYAILLHFFTIS